MTTIEAACPTAITRMTHYEGPDLFAVIDLASPTLVPHALTVQRFVTIGDITVGIFSQA